jgi:effector-binding domain-containing protein
MNLQSKPLSIRTINKEDQTVSLEVKVKTISPKQVLCVTHHVRVGSLSQTIKDTLEILYAMVREQNAETAGPPFGIFHGAINDKEDGPIEICLPVRGNVNGSGNVIFKQLYGGTAASVTMLSAQCEFPAILEGYDSAAAWIKQNGHHTSGPPREIWHTGPGLDARMEIVWLFK